MGGFWHVLDSRGQSWLKAVKGPQSGSVSIQECRSLFSRHPVFAELISLSWLPRRPFFTKQIMDERGMDERGREAQPDVRAGNGHQKADGRSVLAQIPFRETRTSRIRDWRRKDRSQTDEEPGDPNALWGARIRTSWTRLDWMALLGKLGDLESSRLTGNLCLQKGVGDEESKTIVRGNRSLWAGPGVKFVRSAESRPRA